MRFVLAGSGPEEARLRARVEAAGLAGRVVFAGFREDVAGLLAAADLVVHPSHADALPTALIHALAAGVPAVATRVGGIPEIVGDDAGVLVPAGRPGRAGRGHPLPWPATPERRRRDGGRRPAPASPPASRARPGPGRLRALYDEVLAEAGAAPLSPATGRSAAVPRPGRNIAPPDPGMG